MFVLHHIVCIAAAVAFLFFKDGGYNAFMLGTMCSRLDRDPKRRSSYLASSMGEKLTSTTNALGTFHLVAMSASNALAVFVFAPWMWTSAAKNSEGLSLLAATFLAGVTVILCLIRQSYAHGNMENLRKGKIY